MQRWQDDSQTHESKCIFVYFLHVRAACTLCGERWLHNNTEELFFFPPDDLREQSADLKICYPDFLAWGCWLAAEKSNRLINTVLCPLWSRVIHKMLLYLVDLFIHIVLFSHSADCIFIHWLRPSPHAVGLPVCVSPRELSACFSYTKCTWQIKWFWFLFVIFLHAYPNPGTQCDSPWQPSIVFLNTLPTQGLEFATKWSRTEKVKREWAML